MLKHLSGSAWATLEYGWYPLLLFIATPWFLHQLGAEQYGYWMLLAAATGFGGALNTGTGAATIKAVSEGIGRSSSKQVEDATRASLSIALVGGGAFAAVVLLLFWFAGSALLSKMSNLPLLRLTGVAAALLIWTEQQDNVFSSAIKGAEHFGYAARIEMASKTAQIIAAALVLLLWRRLWAVYCALLLIAGIRLFAKIVIAKRLLGFASLRPSMAGTGDLLHFAKWGWLQGVGGTLFGVVDRMLVGSLLGATSLAFYSIATQLSMQIHAIAAAGISVIFPKISRQIESGEGVSLWRITKITMAGNFLLSSLLAAILIVFGPMLLRYWVGPKAAAPTALILPGLVLAYWILALNVVPYYILLGLGRIRFVGLTIFAAGISAAAGMYFAILKMGFIGTPVGRGIYAILTLVLAMPLMHHFLRERAALALKGTPPTKEASRGDAHVD